MGRHPETQANLASNEQLADARKRLLSPSPSRRRRGLPMSREEFADAVNRAISELFANLKNRRHLYVSGSWVGVMERGERRWTSAERRAALRAVTGATSDDELGLYPPRDRLDGALTGGPETLHSWSRRPNPPVGLLEATSFARVQRGSSAAGKNPDGDAFPTHALGMTDADDLDVDLVTLSSMLEQPGIGVAELTAAELACERLDRGFAAVRPDGVLATSHLLMRFVLAQLGRPQTLSHHTRLVALAARLAGLRAWACFDLDDHRAAEHWYRVAITASEDARTWGLGAWLMGAQSLIPWHRRDFRHAAELIDRGVFLAGLGSDATTIAWLHALKARTCAATGDRNGFDAAYSRAQEAAECSNERDRHHGMDFDQGLLDLRYYAGMSWLLLHRPAEARSELNGSLTALPGSHIKARSVLSLGLADAAVQSDEIDHAVDLTRAALTSSIHQPIMPILQQGRRIRRLVHQREPEAAANLDEPLRDFALALTCVSEASGS